MAVEWTEDLAVGVREIDEQHQELFRRFNQLLTACAQGKGRDEIVDLMRFLDEYVKSHFAAEELFQIRIRYPGYHAHREEHTGFIEDMENLRQQIAKEGIGLHLVIETNKMLVNWLIRHISQSDKALGKFAHNQPK